MRAGFARVVMLALLVGSLAGLRLAVRAYRGDLLAGRLANEGPDLSAPVYRELARDALRLNPAAWKPLVPMANDLARKGDTEGAREIVSEALRRHRPIDAVLLEAALAAESGSGENALTLLASLRRTSPASRAIAQVLLGLSADRTADDLERVAREIDASWPGSFDALVALSDVALLESSDPTEGIRRLQAALEADLSTQPSPLIYDPAERRASLRAFFEGRP